MAPGRASRGTILVVDDDTVLAVAIREALESDGYEVWHAVTGAEARSMIDHGQPDLIVLDLILPDVDGLILCSQLRSLLDTPILVCSATNRKADAILSLKLGADDFVAKPFNLEDLEARIEAILRRSNRSRAGPGGTGKQVRVDQLVIDTTRRRVMLGDDEVQLTPTEFRLLSALASQPEQIIARDQLARAVWGYADASDGRTLDVHIRRLRVKLASARGPAPTIVSVRGYGYKISLEESG